MFIALVQAIDVFTLGAISAFLIFFVASWFSYLYRVRKSMDYFGITHAVPPKSVSVIIPVVDEPIELWRNVLTDLKAAIKELDAEVFVVCNGGNGVANGKIAEEMGFRVIFEKQAGKRNAIAVAARLATKELTVILDSDTLCNHDSIHTIACAFVSDSIGGITPQHKIFYRNRNFWRRMSDWLEDSRFNISLRGLSVSGTVNCLPGRLFAIRTNLLKKYLHRFTSQVIFGVKMETGDDRVLTQWLLEDGYKTLFDNDVFVRTNAPDTLKQFAKQRLRWSRSSVREGVLSLKNLFTRATAVSWYSLIDLIFRWWFFAIIVTFAWKILTATGDPHFYSFALWQYILFGFIGFLVNGYLRQLPHLLRRPQDTFYLPVFLLVNLFILTPVEWYGNLTFLKQGWMTRKNH